MHLATYTKHHFSDFLGLSFMYRMILQIPCPLNNNVIPLAILLAIALAIALY